jgi:hypothetical protein
VLAGEELALGLFGVGVCALALEAPAKVTTAPIKAADAGALRTTFATSWRRPLKPRKGFRCIIATVLSLHRDTA